LWCGEALPEDEARRCFCNGFHSAYYQADVIENQACKGACAEEASHRASTRLIKKIG
jgi:hypothetical protein